MPRKLIVWTVATAVLALAALPGVVDSRGIRPADVIPDEAFRDLAPEIAPIAPLDGGVASMIAPADPDLRSASYISPDDQIIDRGAASSGAAIPRKRPAVALPVSRAGRTWKEPRYTISGYASWYDNGTTAMRLPRGTVVVICGAGGCVERVVTDYGPWAGFRPNRIVDLMPGDFAAVCGCPTWKGTAPVTVKVY